MARSEQVASLFAAVGFKIDQRSIQSLNKSLSEIENRVNRIKDRISGVGTKKTNYGAAFKGMERQALGAATGIDTVTKRLNAGIGPLRAYTQVAQTLAYTLGVIRTQGNTRLPRVPGTSGGGGRNAPRRSVQGTSGGGIGGFVNGLIGGPGAFARGLIPGLGLGFAVKEMTGLGRQGIANESAFTALTGSLGAGRQEVGWAKNLANTLGINQNTMMDQYKGFFASVRNNKTLNAQRQNIFKGFSEYGTALRLNPEAMKGGLRALQQMASKGKITAEELYGQMAEHMPGAAQMFAEALGVTEARMRKMMEDGEVLAEDVLPKVAEMMAKTARQGGALGAAVKSSAAEQERFMNAWRQLQEDIFKGGADAGIAKFFKTLTPILQTFGSVLTKIVLPAVGAIAAALEPFFNILKDVFDLIGYFVEQSPILMGVLTALGATLYALSGGMNGFVQTITKAFGVLYRHPAILGFITAMFILQDLIYYMLGGKFQSLLGKVLEKTGVGSPNDSTGKKLANVGMVGAGPVGWIGMASQKLAGSTAAGVTALKNKASEKLQGAKDSPGGLPYNPNLFTPAGAGAAPTQVSITNNITQRPNEDSEQFANRLVPKIEAVMTQYTAK